MERSESIGERLLSRLPRPADLAAYEEKVKSLLEENENKLRQNKWTVRRIWIFVIAVSVPCLWMVAAHPYTSEGNWFLGTTYFWVLFAAIEVAKYEHNQGRVELLKELKQIQLQVLEVQAWLAKSGNPVSDKL
jgi:hypothetical protein